MWNQLKKIVKLEAFCSGCQVYAQILAAMGISEIILPMNEIFSTSQTVAEANVNATDKTKVKSAVHAPYAPVKATNCDYSYPSNELGA